jgi:dUTPase
MNDNEQLLGGPPDGADSNMEAELGEMKCGQVTPIMVESGAKEYVEPSFSKVATEIKAEDESFIPEIVNGSAELRADLSEYESEFVSMAYRTTIEIDCGFSVTIPPGYRAVVNSIPSMASRGLVVTNTPDITEGRVKVYLTNVGKEIVKISHADKFAHMTLYPVYGFEWLT